MIEKTKEYTVEEKLKSLYKLQLIDSRIDEIRNFHGKFPLEVEYLQKEIDELQEKINILQQEILLLKGKNREKRDKIKLSEILINKYKLQQDNVRNNREFESLNKEIEYQKLEIELAQKHIKEFCINIKQKQLSLQDIENFYKRKQKYFLNKQNELEKILSDNKKKEKLLIKKSDFFSKKIELKLLQLYNKIRKGVKDGLAVVPVKRGASVGSYLFIPPQIHSELIQRKNILIDEHSGRILIDSVLAEEIEQEVSLLKINN